MLEGGGDVPDKVFFADTGFEFPELYTYIDRVEETLGFKAERLKLPEGTFEKWFYGKITSGDYEGRIRGFPQEFTPCYWSREAKINQLNQAQKGYDRVCVGIAYDERERMSDKDNRVDYPLVRWKWTEQDCVDYLNKKNLFNPLYVNFDRLGCWLCPKQGEKSLYVLWKIYPDLWEELKKREEENLQLTGRHIKAERSLQDYQRDFEHGRIPDLPKYECWNGCQSVKKAFKMRQMRLCMEAE
jgi:3'-phosphoadenosine 5'-phosphosulfate sulfotransferase (PAPS reductase)/FAD synthetase